MVPLGDVADIRIETAAGAGQSRERSSVAASSSTPWTGCYRPCAMRRPAVALRYGSARRLPGRVGRSVFEHFLREARLMFVVPLALGLILFLLWLAFGALGPALLIF